MRLYAANGRPFRFQTESEVFKSEHISRIEEYYKARFVFDSCVKNWRGLWINKPMAIFHVPDRDASKGYTNYIALYWNEESRPWITDGITATGSFQAVVANDGEVVWSRYRHDYRYSQDGSVWIDGGRDYVRWSGQGELVDVRVQYDRLEVM